MAFSRKHELSTSPEKPGSQNISGGGQYDFVCDMTNKDNTRQLQKGKGATVCDKEVTPLLPGIYSELYQLSCPLGINPRRGIRVRITLLG